MTTLFNTIVSTVPFIQSKFQRRRRGDFADRLNTRFTVVLLAVSSVVLGSAHIWGQPITCWTPAQFQPHWSVFVDQYCYTHGTYFVPFEDDLTQDSSVRHQFKINYYQWVPYILGVQALLFCIPHLLRKFIKSYLEYDVPSVIEHVEGFWASVKVLPELPQQISAFENGPAVFVWEGLRLARRRRCLNLSRCHALATLAQALIAWILFLWMNYVFGGPAVIFDVIAGKDWLVTGHFPRTVHCDFQRRALASSQLETVLCMLHLNIYYEKVLLFLWFWMIFVAIISTVWIFIRPSSAAKGRAKIFKLLEFAAEGEETPSSDRFIRVLGPDGLFVLQQIALNLGNLPASYLAEAMRNCCRRYETEEKMEPKLLEMTFFKLISFLACASLVSTTKEAAEPVEEEPAFHPRGMQQFKGNSNLSFRLLTVFPTDKVTENDDAMFRFGKLESTNVEWMDNAQGDEFNYLKITSKSRSPVMRLYFNPGNIRLASMGLKIQLGYMNDEEEHVTKNLTFTNEDDHQLCPKVARHEYGSCHYHRNKSTFEEFRLPTGDWPKENKGEGRFCTVTLILHEGDNVVLGAAFYALFSDKPARPQVTTTMTTTTEDPFD